MYQRKNFAYGRVATAPSPAASGTTLVLETGQGTRFPNTSGGTYVCVVKQTNLPATPDNAEVVLVTSHDPANDNFTITREQEGSSARTIEVGDEFYLSPTDGVWDQIDKLTTKGDLLGFDTAYARIPVGTDDYVLTADSTDDQGVAWKAIGAESKIIGEVPTGTVNGTNDDFELSEEPFSGTLQVYLNGVRQKITDDYTLSGTTITFVNPPLTGSSILCDFNQNVTPAGNADTLDGQHLSGIVPTFKATGTEINTGTEDGKIVTPKAIADSNVVITDKTQTLTNKTLTSPVINYTSSNITTTARASIYLGSDQSIAKDSYVKINLNTESYDSGNNFDNVTNYEFTCPVNGYYLICGQITFENNTTGTRVVALGVNGVENIRNWTGATLSNNFCTLNISNVKYITSGAKITLLGYQTSGGNLKILGSAYYTFLNIHLLSV